MNCHMSARLRHAIDLNSRRLLKRLQAENAELRHKATVLMLEIKAMRERQAQPVRPARRRRR